MQTCQNKTESLISYRQYNNPNMLQTNSKAKNTVFWDVTPRGSLESMFQRNASTLSLGWKESER
jgi:hypothetical protein